MMATTKKMDFHAEPGKQEMFITREFDAPRELVYRAFTEKKLYAQWIGPKGNTTKITRFEPRNGGSWCYVQKDPNGKEYGFHGVYHEVLPPERMIDTFEFEGLPETGHVSLETATFEELPGNRTKLVIHTVFQSVQDRDGMVQTGMEHGMNESFDRLDELLAALKR
ncbi:MAG TPA: SRPBCC family protein [Candidatus Thermoplasmatota archaeon]|nr:SRPBCC family protein [Candidatus Thermoplasmatota archaeon]